MKPDAAAVLQTMQTLAAETSDRDTLGRAVVAALARALPQASWTGIYWLAGKELHLGPFVGPATDHTRIPVGRGVCGTAVAEDADQLIDDVRALDNYLSCSASVRSELVVLIRARDRVVGQFDLDADAVGAFDEEDRRLVRTIADAFGGLIGPERGRASDV